MNKDKLVSRVLELSELEDWNHNYTFPYGVETNAKLGASPGHNENKWSRLKPIFQDIGLAGKSVLDVGSSDGYFSIGCAQMGASSVVGVDLDELRLERARFSAEVLGVENVEFQKQDIYDRDITFGTRDVILALGVIHRVPNIYGFLERLTQLGRTLVLEFKTSKHSSSVNEWGGGETKVNEFNRLYFVPSIKLINDMLNHFGFKVNHIDRDRSKLKYKRTIIVATREDKPRNLVFSNFKDKHVGERVFLIGNGPSLADTDLNLLKDECTIAMNRIAMIYPKVQKWRPTYYLFSSTNVKDDTWGNEWLSSVHMAIQEKKTISFIASDFREDIDPHDQFPMVNWFDSLTEHKPDQRGEISKKSFSTDIVERIDKSGTTMNLALQIAYHMGFKEIVLVGADLGWTKDSGTNNDPNHFDKNYRANISNPQKANYQMRNVHRLARSVFRNSRPNVKIYNASVSTVLDTYPIIKLENYVKKNEVARRIDEEGKAAQFWRDQTLVPISKKPLIYRGLRKLKTQLMFLLGG